MYEAYEYTTPYLVGVQYNSLLLAVDILMINREKNTQYINTVFYPRELHMSKIDIANMTQEDWEEYFNYTDFDAEEDFEMHNPDFDWGAEEYNLYNLDLNDEKELNFE